MNRNKVFRENARAQLGGSIFSNNWMMALLVCLISSAIISFASSFIVGGLIVTGFLTFGLNRVFLQLIRGQKEKIDIADLFCGTDKFGELLVLHLMQTLFTVLWTLLFIIPGIVKGYAYSMAFYIKHDHPEYDWRQCLDISLFYDLMTSPPTITNDTLILSSKNMISASYPSRISPFPDKPILSAGFLLAASTAKGSVRI